MPSWPLAMNFFSRSCTALISCGLLPFQSDSFWPRAAVACTSAVVALTMSTQSSAHRW